ncbi:alpha/beta fold hydrolase [Williamsia sp. CHRR-6]|uniref:alpha/beta fold hydrolase n=1 Tax=Williamsia sp. CHRR-6 TaxID=2835871 RepID=UPI001BDB1E1E|nr:alpha/beta fold hydrolase [Williamsia sp. CHRR-6]MBT0565639.1 alpha/beta fold hydrolase [Williamsia sp. CHRR-6]
MSAMSVTTFGPPDAPTVLALHGLTGHGKRWAALAQRHLPDLRIVAPDLLGHAYSSWAAPWRIEDQVAAIVEVLDRHTDGPVVVVGHSYGGALAVHLSRAVGDRVPGLVLLDPAIGLDGARMAEVAAANIDTFYLRDANDAFDRKRSEAWWEVPEEQLRTEIADHLTTDAAGRVCWRIHLGAVTTSWSELARPFVTPDPGAVVRIVVADKVQPPYATPQFIDAVIAGAPDRVQVHHEDCDHMVPQSRPELTAQMIREVVSLLSP